MATTLREVGRSAACIGLGLIALGQDVQAQAQAPAQDPASAQAQAPAPAPVPVNALPAFTPTLSAQVSYSDNATQATKDNRKSDTILSVSPGVSVQYRGANSTVNGQMQLTAVNYTNNTQSDRILPSGRMALHTDVARKGVGLDAVVSAEQVQSQFGSVSPASTSTLDSYTNTRVQISPFLERQLDAQTTLRARLDRTQLHSTANSSALANRPDTSSSGASLNVSRRPTRLGDALDATYLRSEANGQPGSLYTERRGRATGLYALTPELEVGLVVGRESIGLPQQDFRDTIKGVKADWRPSDRTQLKATVEDRFFGRGWSADVSHRAPMFSLGLLTSRDISTYANGNGLGLIGGGSTQALLDAMLTTRIPNEVDRAKVVNDLIVQRNLPSQLGVTRDIYDLNTQLRQSTVLRAAFMGVRSTVLLSGGHVSSRPVASDAFSALLGPGNDTRERYVDTQLNHRLTPASTFTIGLRLSRARVTSPLTGITTSPRDTGLRMSVATALSPRTQLVWGLRRLRSAGNTANDTIKENVAFTGLEHRF